MKNGGGKKGGMCVKNFSQILIIFSHNSLNNKGIQNKKINYTQKNTKT